MPTNIRILDEFDAETFRILRMESLHRDSDAWTSSFEEEKSLPLNSFVYKLRSAVANPVFGYYGVFDGNKLIAYAQLSPHFYNKKKHIATLYDVLVSQKSRGKNIGTDLINYIIEKARSSKTLEQIELKVISVNTKAISFYEKLGFKKVAVLPNAVKLKDGNYQDEYVYLKNIKTR